MSQITLTNQVIRECKGAAMSVLVLLILNPGGVTQEFLERYSGYTDKPVSQALAYLQETGRVVHTRSGWQLTAGMQLPLPLEPECLPTGDNSDTNYQGRNNTDSIIISSGIKLNNIEDSNNNNKDRKNSDSVKTDAELEAVWVELSRAGIIRNERTEALAELEHITADYVLSQRLGMEAEGRDKHKWSGLLIRRLERNDPAEALNENRHLVTCKCKECRPYREMSNWFDADGENASE